MKYARNDKVISRALDDETALLDTETGYLHVLNATGTEIWELLECHRSLDELVAEMRLRYEGQVDTISLSTDIEELLLEFERHGLVAKLSS